MDKRGEDEIQNDNEVHASFLTVQSHKLTFGSPACKVAALTI